MKERREVIIMDLGRENVACDKGRLIRVVNGIARTINSEQRNNWNVSIPFMQSESLSITRYKIK